MKYRAFAKAILVVLISITVLVGAAENRVAVVLSSEGEVVLKVDRIEEKARTLQVVPASSRLVLSKGAKIKLRFLADGHHEMARGPCELVVQKGGLKLVAGAGRVERGSSQESRVNIPKHEDVRRAGGELQAQNPSLPQLVALEQPRDDPASGGGRLNQQAAPAPQAELTNEDKGPPHKSESHHHGAGTSQGAVAKTTVNTQRRLRSPERIPLPKVSYFTSGTKVRLYPQVRKSQLKYTVSVNQKTNPGVELKALLPPGTHYAELTSPGYLGTQKVVILDEKLSHELAQLKARAETAEKQADYLATLLQYSLLHEARLYNEKLVKLHPKDAGLWAQLGWIWHHLGDQDQADRAFEKARALD